MPNTIHIPTPLRPFTDKKESVEVSGGTVGELLVDLTTRYEGLRKHLYTDEGRLRNFVNVYLNDEDIRYLQREQTPVKPGDSLSIVPSVAGGAPSRASGWPSERRAGTVERGTAEPVARRDQALQPPPDHAGGRHGRSAQAEGRQRALHRRRRAGLAGGDVSRRRRHRPHRHRRLRRRRLQQPAAAAAARDARRRTFEERVGEGPPQRPQPARAGRHLRDAAQLARTRWSCSRTTTSSSTAPTIFRRGISSTTPA